MNRIVHRFSLFLYTLIILLALVIIGYMGNSYYKIPVEERYFHPDYALFKPSGVIGHGLGILGTLFILIGLFSYMARKHIKAFSKVGLLKYWLEFHIFLCTLGTVLVMYHTSFKFGGIVSVGFWSMVIVWSSGVIGRFIYLQIPRSIEGRELSLNEVQELKTDLNRELKDKYDIDLSELHSTKTSEIQEILAEKRVSSKDYRKVKRLIRKQKSLSRRISRLDLMHRIFNYWHVAHLPFALIMLIILVIHVAVVLTFGYKWIF